MFIRSGFHIKLLASLLALFSSIVFVNCGAGPRPASSTTPIITFAASSTSITSGEFVTLTWSVANADSITITPSLNESDDGTALPLKGTRTLALQTTTSYTLTAIGPGGNSQMTVTVAVKNTLPTITLTADPTTIASGASAQLTWLTTAATSLNIDNGIGDVNAATGSVKVSPTATTTYTATATGPGGTTTAAATVTVASPAELVVSLAASKTNVTSGEAVTLTWASQNAASLSISGLGAVNFSGSAQVTPTTTTTYVATATDAAGTAKTASVTVNVIGAAQGINNLNHIIFFIQENRSFDNYFGRLGQYRQSKGLPSDVDGLDLTLQLKTYSGKTVTPFHQRTVETDVMSPSWNESHFYLDRQADGSFKMDNWMQQQQCSIYVLTDPDCTRTMGYYDQRDIPFYYELATQFATSDRFFSSALSGTIVNRSFLMAATAAGVNNPGDTFPAQTATIFRKLSEAGITWRYYYQDDSVFLGYYSCGGACDWDKYQSNVYPISNYYEILSRPTADQDLPQVIFIEHAAKLRLDEHTGNNIQLGVADAQQIINALMQSSAWPTSAFLLSHDEGGGLYDHVPPFAVPNPDSIAPIFDPSDIGQWDNFTYSGYRVPLIVVSPWVKPNYVSHVNREFTSILKFIETRFGITPLTQRDAQADDMTEMFDFTKPAWLTPPPLPTQPTNGVVDRSLQIAY